MIWTAMYNLNGYRVYEGYHAASAIPLKMTCCYTSAIVAICSGVIWRACKSRMLLEVCEVMQHFNILQEAYRILPKAAQSYDEIRNIITSQM